MTTKKDIKEPLLDEKAESTVDKSDTTSEGPPDDSDLEAQAEYYREKAKK